jgi:ubiquinone/menaquinone biosynthesis C-methylase UbiE/uncharacterized protein YbaR (Trm112 family)
MKSLVKLVCPECRVDLSGEQDAKCPKCGQTFPLREGILSFVEPEASYNPTRFQGKQEKAWSSSAILRDRIRKSAVLSLVNRLRIRFSMSGRRDRIFFNEMRGGDRKRIILDVGCGGGRHYFTEYGRVVGVDPVMELLHISKTLYNEVYHASATALPFPDASFDYVVSSDVMGHIPVDLKDKVFSEIFRVLRPGGRTVHVIETDATNVWYRFAHTYPELFEEYFVQVPGHISMELPSELRARFLKHGFREITFRKYAGFVQDCGGIAGVFNNDYKRKSIFIRIAVEIDRLFSSNLLVREAMNLILEPFAQVADRFTPFDYANGAMVVYEKPASAHA